MTTRIDITMPDFKGLPMNRRKITVHLTVWWPGPQNKAIGFKSREAIREFLQGALDRECPKDMTMPSSKELGLTNG